jgi:hypothetical protein
VGGDLDAGLNPFVEHERVAMKRRELWESIGRRHSRRPL